MNIHLLEDEPAISTPLSNYLEKEGFKVTLSKTLAQTSRYGAHDFDLHILDWRLPDGEGVDYLKCIRRISNSVPVIMLSAKADLVDKVLGIELGANDYITKPFEPRELLARIKRHLEIANINCALDSVSDNPFSIDTTRRVARFKGEDITLKKLEFDLLAHLLENAEVVFSREELLQTVWKCDGFPTTRTVDNHILSLRKKTESRYFKTIHAAGYKFTLETNDNELTAQ